MIASITHILLIFLLTFEYSIEKQQHICHRKYLKRLYKDSDFENIKIPTLKKYYR